LAMKFFHKDWLTVTTGAALKEGSEDSGKPMNVGMG